jgi:hypothetical protein
MTIATPANICATAERRRQCRRGLRRAREALSLVASFLDAAASSVSTSWQAAFAADHLWARL